MANPNLNTGSPVAKFMLPIHDDGTAGRRWHDEPFSLGVPATLDSPLKKGCHTECLSPY
ncbi:hypothetical protein GCM10020254_82970 [Streptomyces goshikiensis]